MEEKYTVYNIRYNVAMKSGSTKKGEKKKQILKEITENVYIEQKKCVARLLWDGLNVN